MKKNSIFQLAIYVLLSMFFVQNAQASVCVKNQISQIDRKSDSSKAVHRSGEGNAVRMFSGLPLANLVIRTVKWRLHRWMESRKVGGKDQANFGNIKIVKVNEEVMSVRAVKLTQDSIFFQLSESAESAWKSAPIREINRVQGLHGELLYGNSDFEYFSLFSLLSLFLGVALLIVGGPLTIVLGSLFYLNSIVFGVISLVRLDRHKQRYEKVGLAYFLAILSLFLSIVGPLIGILLILAAFGNH